jgi:hypothetical protein
MRTESLGIKNYKIFINLEGQEDRHRWSLRVHGLLG